MSAHALGKRFTNRQYPFDADKTPNTPNKGGIDIADFVEVPIPGGSSLLVEVTESDDEVVPAGRLHDLADSATESFESALERVARAAEAARQRLKKLEPTEITVEFAVKLASEAGVVIASTSLEANLKLQVRWAKE